MLASHLKPLDKEDKMPTTIGFRQPWNTMADGSAAAGPSKQSQDISLVGLNFMCAYERLGAVSTVPHKNHYSLYHI